MHQFNYILSSTEFQILSMSVVFTQFTYYLYFYN